MRDWQFEVNKNSSTQMKGVSWPFRLENRRLQLQQKVLRGTAGLSPPPPLSPVGQRSLSHPWCICRTFSQHVPGEGPLALGSQRPARLALQTGSFILMATLHLFCCNLKHFSSYPVLSGCGEQITPLFFVVMFHTHLRCSRSRHSCAFPPRSFPGGVNAPARAGTGLMHLSRTLISGIQFPCHHWHSLSYWEKVIPVQGHVWELAGEKQQSLLEKLMGEDGNLWFSLLPKFIHWVIHQFWLWVQHTFSTNFHANKLLLH